MLAILGVDPGLAHMGLATLCLDNRRDDVSVGRLAVLSTTKSDKKQKVLAAEDNVRRTLELYHQLHQWLGYDQNTELVAVAAEAQSWPRNAASSAKVGIAWGVIAALAAARSIPILQVPPKVIKRTLCGSGSASKLEVQTKLSERFGPLLWPEPASLIEHASDALGAAVCCLSDPSILAVRRAAVDR